MKQINDIVFQWSETRRRGGGKPAVCVLFNKPTAYWYPSYEEIETILRMIKECEKMEVKIK